MSFLLLCKSGETFEKVVDNRLKDLLERRFENTGDDAIMSASSPVQAAPSSSPLESS